MQTKVLIGEDNLVTQQVLKAMLEAKNCQVAVASTYEDLMQKLQNTSFSLLLLDYHLDQDADFILEKIRNLNNDNSTLPVYIMSAGKRDDIIDKISSYKVDGFLEKPIDKKQLTILPLNKAVLTSDSENHFIKSIIGDNPNRIKAINDFFITEVPPALTAIEKYLQSNDFTDAKKLVHKIRPAYTYIGRDDIQIKMRAWEHDLAQGKNPEDYRNILNQVCQETEKIISTFSPGLSNEATRTQQLQNTNYSRLNGLKVLIVDDNQVILSVFTSLLHIYNVEVHTAMNGSEGVSETLSKHPSLILMDIHMPEMDGVEAISIIREKGIKVPIIAI
ncbi:response regulator, partial [Fulvivirga sp.]|uniref:response regulator n=1 Tax=Fulvivirga sp. TaxID=1931237 RepID=UPI0032F097A0